MPVFEPKKGLVSVRVCGLAWFVPGDIIVFLFFQYLKTTLPNLKGPVRRRTLTWPPQRLQPIRCYEEFFSITFFFRVPARSQNAPPRSDLFSLLCFL